MDSIFQSPARYHRAVIGEQHSLGSLGGFVNIVFHCAIAGAVIADDRQKPPDTHHEIGCEWRDGRDLSGFGKAGNGGGVGGMQMHHRPCIGPCGQHRAMHEDFLGRLVARNIRKIRRQFRYARGIKPAQAGIGRRHQKPIWQAHTDIARCPHRITTRKKRGTERGELSAQRSLIHGRKPSGRNRARRNCRI